MVNEPSVFELSRFDCIDHQRLRDIQYKNYYRLKDIQYRGHYRLMNIQYRDHYKGTFSIEPVVDSMTFRIKTTIDLRTLHI